MTETTPAYYTAQAISELFGDDAKRTQFMNVFGSDPDAAAKFMVDQLQMPADLAKEVAEKSGPELASFVGQNVCDYLW